MGKDVCFKLKPEIPLTEEEIAMIDAAKDLPVETDEDNPENDPVATPRQYAPLMQAVAERNRRIAGRLREMG